MLSEQSVRPTREEDQVSSAADEDNAEEGEYEDPPLPVPQPQSSPSDNQWDHEDDWSGIHPNNAAPATSPERIDISSGTEE